MDVAAIEQSSVAVSDAQPKRRPKGLAVSVEEHDAVAVLAYATMPVPGVYQLAAGRALEEGGRSTNGEVIPAQ